MTICDMCFSVIIHPGDQSSSADAACAAAACLAPAAAAAAVAVGDVVAADRPS